MRLLWAEVRDFRNHRETSIELPGGLSAFVGPNAEGKTNLLEAMYYLFALESPRVRADLPLVRSGAASAYLRGEVVTDGGRYLVEVEVRSSGANRVRVNRSLVRRRRDVRRHIRGVFSGPDDLAVVAGDPDDRRRYMDEALRTLWPPRESLGPAYDRVLRQRNRLLKDWDGSGTEPIGLPTWDDELAAAGGALTAGRSEAVDRIRDPAGSEFQTLSGEPLAMAYLPSVEGEPLAEAFRARLAERKADELVRRITLVGPHRDDLSLTVRRLQARGFASHGETWGVALCLRLGLARAVRDEMSEDPVVFLDDPFSALDPDRRHRVAGTLEGRGQTVIAVPEDAQIPPGATVWHVRGGRVHRE